jgi:hypothetical protein
LLLGAEKNRFHIKNAQQLSSIDVNFNNRSVENIYPDLATDSEYFNGIFFANIEPKDNYLLHLFKTNSTLPQKVIFIDDKLSQVESVANALAELVMPHESYFYSATDKKGKNFNPLIANIQLYYFYDPSSRLKTMISISQLARKSQENLK